MTIQEQALEMCDKSGITDQNERRFFVMGYMHGHQDARIEFLDEELERLRRRRPNSFPDAETR